MAAPPEKTLTDLNGVWIMNKTLSDDTDYILQMQSVGWFLRKAISMATVTLTITQYVNDTPHPSTTHIDIKQVATGGISGTTENRTLDWTPRDHKDNIFGKVKGKSRWTKLSEVDDDEFIKSGFEDLEGVKVQAWAESEDYGWTANQTWGFEDIDGERRYTRRVVVRKGDDWKLARLVYDYHGAAAKTSEEDDDLAYE